MGVHLGEEKSITSQNSLIGYILLRIIKFKVFADFVPLTTSHFFTALEINPIFRGGGAYLLM